MFVNIKGQQIYYQVTGRGENLILLHGWKQDVSSFWPLVDLLKNDFKLWLIDLPGFGRSDNPKKPFSLINYSKIVAEFIKQNHIKKPIILGHSLGGNIAVKFAANYPNFFSKLILEDSSGLRPENNSRGLIYLIAAKIIKYLIPDTLNLKEKLRVKFYKSIGSDYLGAEDLKLTLQNILNSDISKDATKIKNETLIIWGENDQAVPLASGKTLYQLIPNSKFILIENVGHFPHLENPDLFTYYVKDFS